MPRKLSFLLHTLTAAALACACAAAIADSAVERVNQQGKLVAGVGFVPPPYVAGAKFRTPESVDAALTQELAARMKAGRLETMHAASANRLKLLSEGKVDVVVAAISDSETLPRSAAVVPTGYSFGPMAIMRSDTDIKTWEQLKGRKVCISEDGQFAGTIAAKYGAIEKVFKAPADSLLALRTGGCDAAVHDSALLEELLKLPEWKKFSARLPIGPSTSVGFIVPAGNADTVRFLKQVSSEWRSSGYLDKLTNKNARSIAFEVYLDQNVPDCH